MKKFVTKYITEKRIEIYIRQGKCPVCMLRLDSIYHTNCPYLEEKQIIDNKNGDNL